MQTDTNNAVQKPISNANADTKKHVSKRDEQLPQLQNVVLKTHHYKPSPELVEYLAYFSTLHRFDDRETYKEAWDEWIHTPDVASLLEDEIARLQHTGYTGNPLSKIYKSARYYYRKKPLAVAETVEGKKRKKYEGLPSDVLDAMDVHIAQCIKAHIVAITQTQETQQIQMKSSVSPSDAYKQYVDTFAEPLDEVMATKYKKTFKNRFFLYRNKLHK